MTLTELRYIVALAQTHHFGRAAKACHVSQPTLSVAINKLEKSLGTSLFERRPNDIRITDMGEKIIQQAQRVLEEADKIKALSAADKDQLATPLRVGAIYTVGPYLLPKLIPKLKQIAANMPLMIQESFTATLNNKLQSGELDAIFIALPFKQAGIVTKELYEEEFVVLLPKSHPLAQQESIKANQLGEYSVLLLGEGHCFRDQIIDLCPQCIQGNDLQQTIENGSLETLRAMVASGYGITILPKSAANQDNYSNSLTTRPFSAPAPKRRIALAWRDSFPRTKAISALISAFNDADARLIE